MKRALSLLCFLFFSFQLLTAAPGSVYAPKKGAETTEVQNQKETKKNLRKERKMRRFSEKWDKLKAKIQKKEVKNPGETTNIWNDGKFRLGIILLAGAIGLGIVSVLISLGGLLNLIAGLCALAGVIFIVWSLIEYYA